MTAPTTAPAVEAIAGFARWVTKQHASGPIRLYADVQDRNDFLSILSKSSSDRT